MFDAEIRADSPRQWPQPGEVWSLWDAMKHLNMHALITAGHDSRYARDRYFDHDNPKEGLTDENKGHVKEALVTMADVCEIIGASETMAYLKSYIEDLPTSVDVYDAVANAFWHAVDAKQVLFLDKSELGYLFNKSPFGEAAAKVFSDSMFDVESASRALAFNMPTAAVFHLMRAMESAVGAMARKLGVTNCEVEWGKILGPMDDKIKLMSPGPEKKKWSEARADLWHVKECWRNETMHPRRYYTQEQGEEIFRAVKTFMAHLASLVAPPPPPKPKSKPEAKAPG